MALTTEPRLMEGLPLLARGPEASLDRYGELVQIDGSEHHWFEARSEPCALLTCIEGATAKLMQLRFVASESTESYFVAPRGYLDAHGCPTAFYSDIRAIGSKRRAAQG